MFHLSLPVHRFEDCLAFYVSCFNAEVVALGPGAANLFVFGAQITLHDDPGSPLTHEARQALHFGVVLSAERWTEVRQRLEDRGVPLLRAVEPSADGRRGKLVVSDPSGNLVEINAHARPD